MKKDVERVETGIDGLDELIEGGIPKGSVVLLTGSAGTGKTILALQYLVHGAKMGEKGLYMSFEENKGDILAQARQFGWDIEGLEKKGLLQVVNFPIAKSHVLNITMEMENLYAKMKPDRLVVDSLSILGVYSEMISGVETLESMGMKGMTALDISGLTTRKTIMILIGKLKEMGATALVTSELPEESNWLSRDTISEFMCDGVIKLNAMEALGKRTLTVKKMRATKHNFLPRGLKIEAKGVVIE